MAKVPSTPGELESSQVKPQDDPPGVVEQGTVEMVPMHSVILSRPTNEKDKNGNPVHRQHVPEVGRAFKFTQAEVDHVKATSPAALRDPTNEGTSDFLANIDQAGAAAADAARRHGSAAGDARRVAQGGAGEKAKLADNQKSQGSIGELPAEEDI